jgi:hypothetical protein
MASNNYESSWSASEDKLTEIEDILHNGVTLIIIFIIIIIIFYIIVFFVRVFFYRFGLHRLEWDDASAENLIAECAKVSWRFETPDQVTRRPILTCVDVALDVDVDFRPERSQGTLRGEKVVHELFIVSSNKLARRLDVHVLRLHQYGHEVIALQAPAKFHVVGIQVLELNKKESTTQLLALDA